MASLRGLSKSSEKIGDEISKVRKLFKTAYLIYS